MTTGERVVTTEQLEKIGACGGTLDFLRDQFGESFEVSEENALACATEIDWGWAANNLLPAHLLQQYKEAANPLWQQYEKAKAPLRQQYQEAVAPLRQQYEESVAPLLQQYKEAADSLWQQHEKAKAPLRQQYQKACARLFVSIYNQDKEANL